MCYEKRVIIITVFKRTELVTSKQCKVNVNREFHNKPLRHYMAHDKLRHDISLVSASYQPK